MTRSRLVLLVPVLAALTLLWRGLFGGELLLAPDVLHYNYPLWESLGAAFSDGQLPRWNPWANGGQPWFGPRGGVLYPANLLFGALPLGLGAAVYFALHVVLATEGMRRLASRHSGPWGGLAAGLAFGLGGFCVHMLGFPAHLVSAAWLPWAALGGVHLAKGAVGRGVAPGGCAVAMCFLVGEPQGALICAGFLVGYAVVGSERTAEAVRRALVFGGGAVALGLAAGGLWVTSVLSLLGETDRSLFGYAVEGFGLLPGHLLLEAAVPGVLGLGAALDGGYWGFALSADQFPWTDLNCGTLGLALALYACARSPSSWDRGTRQGALLLVLGVALAAVDPGALINLRYPAKWLVVSAFGLALLVGAGVRRFPQRDGLMRAWLALVAVLGLGLGAWLLLRGGDAVERWFESTTTQWVVGEAARSATGGALLRAAVVALVGIGLCRVGRRRFLVALLLFDLLTVALPIVETTNQPIRGPAELTRRLEALSGDAPLRFAPRRRTLRVSYAPGEGEHPRPLEEDFLFARDVLWANRGYPLAVRTVGVFSAVEPLGHALFKRASAYTSLPLPDRMAIFGVDVLLVDRSEYDGLSQHELANLELLGPVSRGVQHVAVARNLAARPWASLVTRGGGVAELDEAVLATVELRAGGVSDVVVLGPEGGGLELPAAASTGEASTVEVVRFQPERIELEVTTPSPRWLVVQEAFSSDWVAEVDGQPQEIARADVLFRAVPVAAGRHAVVFRYEPTWWLSGVLLTLFGWIALVAAAWIGRRSPPEVGGTPLQAVERHLCAGSAMIGQVRVVPGPGGLDGCTVVVVPDEHALSAELVVLPLTRLRERVRGAAPTSPHSIRIAEVVLEWPDDPAVDVDHPVARRLLERLAEILDAPGPFTPAQRFEADLGLDSLDLLNVRLLLDEEFGATFGDDEVWRLRTVGSAIRRAVAGGSSPRSSQEVDCTIRARLREPPAVSLEQRFNMGRDRGGLHHVAAELGILFVTVMSRLLYRMELLHGERLPTEGPFLLCPTHESLIDSPLVYAAFPNALIHRTVFLAYGPYFRSPPLSGLERMGRLVLTGQGDNLAESLRLAWSALERGWGVLLFPEGNCSYTGSIMEARRGVGVLACEAQVPIVPVLYRGSDGTYSPSNPGFHLPKIRLVVGEPIQPPPPGSFGRADYQAMADRWREAVLLLEAELT